MFALPEIIPIYFTINIFNKPHPICIKPYGCFKNQFIDFPENPQVIVFETIFSPRRSLPHKSLQFTKQWTRMLNKHFGYWSPICVLFKCNEVASRLKTHLKTISINYWNIFREWIFSSFLIINIEWTVNGKYTDIHCWKLSEVWTR